MKERFLRFMSGRYGGDQFSRFLNIASLVLIVVSMIVGACGLGMLSSVFWGLAFAAMITVIFRMFSKNTSKRYAENAKYLQLSSKVKNYFKNKASRIKQLKTHRFFKCPKCAQVVRTPKGKGKIKITCPKCGETFIRKS